MSDMSEIGVESRYAATVLRLHRFRFDLEWRLWNDYLWRLGEWKRACALAQEEWERHFLRQVGNSGFLDTFLAAQLRRLAKINPENGGPSVGPDMHGGGKAGPRSCAVGAWDNSVRAIEDG